MPPNSQSPDLRELVTSTLQEIFENMVSMKVQPADGPFPDYPERVIGSVGFGGELVNGALFIYLSESLALEIAAAILGIKPEEISGESEVNDAVSEVSNMLGGGFKSRLSDAGIACGMSTPSIIRGTSFVVETPSDVRQEKFIFQTGKHRICVELHIKFSENPT